MVIGNVMGSNIANALLVLGLSGAVHPIEVPESSVVRTIPVLIFFSLGLRDELVLKKKEPTKGGGGMATAVSGRRRVALPRRRW